MRRRKKKPKPIEARIPIHEFAAQLNANLPKSEKWFQGLWKARYEDPGDKYNDPLRGRIPDLVNHIYRYVIEVDGAVHTTKAQRKIDRIKNSHYERLGYQVFRVVAYDELQLTEAGECVERIRRAYTAHGPKVVLIRRQNSDLTIRKAS